MRHLLFIIITAFGLLATQQQAAGAGKPVRQEDKSHTIVSAESRPISYAEHVPVARVLTAKLQRRDHRALDDCYLPAQAILFYTFPAHTPITDKQVPAIGQQRLLLLFPQHYFW
jgi:hypothetical protein